MAKWQNIFRYEAVKFKTNPIYGFLYLNLLKSMILNYY